MLVIHSSTNRILKLFVFKRVFEALRFVRDDFCECHAGYYEIPSK